MINTRTRTREVGEKSENWVGEPMLNCKCQINAGVHLKADYSPLNMGLTEMSRSRFNKESKNPSLIGYIYVLWCFVKFWVMLQRISKI